MCGMILINKNNRKMKHIKIILILFVTGLVSCSADETGGVSSVTNYPIITLNGDALEFITQGTTYNDPGAVATEGDAEIPVETSAGSGSYFGNPGIDTSTPDQYFITYSAENADGFSGSALREVWVVPPTGDLTTSIEGLYTSDVQRAPTFTPSAQYDDMEYIIISKTGANTYAITDAVGGYYDLGRGFGNGYSAQGAIITANDIATNDFTITQAVFPIWGNTADITLFTVDAASKTITFDGNGNFGNGTFRTQLTQVQF